MNPLVFWTVLVLAACVASTTAIAEDPVYEPLDAEITGRSFESALTDYERWLLRTGEYSGLDIALSGGLGTIVGFGTGHLAQGRYDQGGWVYTLGEGLSFTALGTLPYACQDNIGCVVTVVGVTGGVFLGFKIFEAIDVWTYPTLHNRSVRELELRRVRKEAIGFAPFVAPHPDADAVVGFALRF